MLPLHDIHLHPLLIIRNISILPFSLRDQEPGNYCPQNAANKEYPQHIRQTQQIWSAEVIEQECRNDSAEFAYSSAGTVREATDARGEDFGSNDEGGGVGAKIEEEL